MSKDLTPKEWKKRDTELKVGLGNNLFGAAMGGVATGSAYGAARQLARKSPEEIYDQKIKVPGTKKSINWGQGLKRLKLKPRPAALVGGGALVGGQLINAGADAQSASFFGREYVKNKRNKPKGADALKKSLDSGHAAAGARVGRSMNGERSAIAKRSYESRDEAEQARRVRLAAGVGGGAAAGTLAGLYGSKELGRAIRASRAEKGGIKGIAVENLRMDRKPGTDRVPRKFRGSFKRGTIGLLAAPAIYGGTARLYNSGKQRWE